MNSKSEEKLSQTENEVKPILRSEWEKTHQTETLTWHKYPEVKPKDGKWYLTQDDVSESLQMTRWIGCLLGAGMWDYSNSSDIVAWADPKGWNENKE